jgi:hypothetical protein
MHIWSDGTRLVSHLATDDYLDIFMKKADTSAVDLPTLIFKDSYHLSNRTNFLCSEALQSMSVQNAGGASELSEALSIHYFFRRFRVTKFMFEMDISYDFYGSSICDFLCDFGTYRVGVSVTRAMHFYDPSLFADADADRLLTKKLWGLIVARNGVSDKHSFHKCCLHIWCQTQHIADTLVTAHQRLIDLLPEDDPIREVVVILTVCDAPWIYTNCNQS